MRVRILLADDHEMLRAGLRSMLEDQTNWEVVAEADNGRDAVELAEKNRPNVVVMDVGMPDLNGIEATRKIASACPNTRVLALSMHSDRRFVEGMLGAGAAGYMLKDSAFERLVEAIRTVMQDNVYLCPEVAGVVVDGFVGGAKGSDASPFSVLTPREREVLQLMAEGDSTKEIASKLGVSVKTIETHRSRLMKKLEIRSVAELTKYAIREGLTSLDS